MAPDEHDELRRSLVAAQDITRTVLDLVFERARADGLDAVSLMNVVASELQGLSMGALPLRPPGFPPDLLPPGLLPPQ